RGEAARPEAERLEAERAEADRAEAERLEAERAEAAHAEAERLEAERAEAARAEQERLAVAAPSATADDDLVSYMRDLRRSDRLHHDPHAEGPAWDELSAADLETDGTDESVPAVDPEPTPDA